MNYFNFVLLREIPNLKLNSLCDVIGIIENVQDPIEIHTKTNKVVKKMDIVLKDEDTKVNITFWGHNIDLFNISSNKLVIFKNVQVKEFKGFFLNFTSESKII